MKKSFSMSTIMESLIVEKMGVPDNISETAEEIYNQILSSFTNIKYVDKQGEWRNEIHGTYQVSDFNFDVIDLFIVFTPIKAAHETVLGNMGSGNDLDMDLDTFKITFNNTKGVIHLIITFYYNPTNKNFIADSYKILQKDPHQHIAILSHELLHAYHTYKKKYSTSRKESDYQVFSSGMGIEELPTVNVFIGTLYYLSEDENLTRPSQIASEIRTRKITKSQFRDFLLKHPIYQKLNQIKNYTWDNFRRDFWNDIKNHTELRGRNEEEIFNAVLNSVFTYITNAKIRGYKEFLSSEAAKTAMKSTGDMQKMSSFLNGKYERNVNNEFHKYINSTYGDKNAARFFENTIKMFNFVANELLKKISKLYDMAKDDTNQVDINSKINQKMTKLNENPVEYNKDSKITKEDIIAATDRIKKTYYYDKKK